MKNEIIDYKLKKDYQNLIKEFDALKKICYESNLDLKSLLIGANLFFACEPIYRIPNLTFGGNTVILLDNSHFNKIIIINNYVGTLDELRTIYDYFTTEHILTFGSADVEYVTFENGSYSDKMDTSLPETITIGNITGTWEELVNIIEHYHD